MKKIIGILLIIILIMEQGFLLYVNADNNSKRTDNEPKNLYAQSACLMDADSGRVLFEKNGEKEMPMASTTKIMTCIVTLENADLDDTVTFSKRAAGMPDVQLNAMAGEKFKLRDLLFALMLESHNDVAVAIAEHVGGSVEKFADMMNQKAKELGCTHTNFVTPNGLDAPEHKTTAVELGKIAAYAIRNKEFIKITNTPSRQFKELTKGRSFCVNNKDRFLSLFDGAIGVKTGFTGKAGYCFVGAVQQTDKTLISVVLACGWPPHKEYKWADTKKLMNYGVKNYEKKQIFNNKKEFTPIPVADGQKKQVSVSCTGSISVLMREDEQVKEEYDIPQSLAAPVKAGEVIGYANYYIDGRLYKKIPVYARDTIDKIDFPFCFRQILERFLFDIRLENIIK